MNIEELIKQTGLAMPLTINTGEGGAYEIKDASDELIWRFHQAEPITSLVKIANAAAEAMP